MTLDRLTIRRNHAIFEYMVGKGRHSLRDRAFDSAIAWASIASAFATHHVTTLLYSPELETLLQQVAATLPLRPRPPTSTQRRVLHVLTRAAEIGGHGRLVRSWIAADASSASSVLLTEQATCPADLARAARASGGEVVALSKDLPLLERAAALRNHASRHDLVVVSHHGHDVVPLAALSYPARPPVVICNHADHSFWLGVHVADVIADIRPAGQQLTRERRGIPPSSCVFLPMPVRVVDGGADGRRARAKLGIPADAVVLLTVAEGQKYLGAHPHLSDLLARVMEAHEEAWLAVVGPGDDPPWPDLRARFGPRVTLLPPTPDLDDLRAAADIYVDSYPTGSLTSLLDSAVLATPVVSLQYTEREAILRSDSPIMEAANVVFDPTDFVSELSRLTSSSDQRAAAGRRVHEAAHRQHSLQAMAAAVAETYRLAGGYPARSRPRPTRDPGVSIHNSDVQVARYYEAAGWVAPLDQVVKTVFPGPRSARVSAVLLAIRAAQAAGALFSRKSVHSSSR